MTPRRSFFLVLLLLLVAATVAVEPAAAQFGKNKVQYRDFDWQIYHSTHFDVYYYTEDADLLQKVVSFAESAYDHLSREFDHQIQEPTPLIVYETHSAFEQNNIILNFIPEGVGAFASPVRNRMVMPLDLADPDLMALMLHELTHIFQYHILFGGRIGRGVASSPPTWVMEGMASYMAKDETARDRMFLRDAVVNDRIPSVSLDFGGFFAYRFGHAVFDFMEERWGQEGFRDFVVELRNTFGGRVDRALERTFQIDPEDFDMEFRRWLRQRYLAELLETGEPSDFGRPFRTDRGPTQETSPVASPGGDLVAAFSTERGDVDVVLFDSKSRTLLSNLTKGYTNDFQYFVAQELTLGWQGGRDLTFSPDGNRLAVFARRNKGRSLVILDVLKKKIEEIVPMDGVEQQLAPAWSPDGRTVAFSAWADGQFDIFLLDLETREVSNLTRDEVFDAAPTYSPDGSSIVFTSVVGGFSKLFRVSVDDPSVRYQLTTGEHDETDPVFSADGERIYFTSDRTGANNIYGLDLGSGVVRQYTNSVTGCFQPTVLTEPDGEERLVYTAFWKGRFDLYRLDVDDPITEPILIAEGVSEEAAPLSTEDLPRFEPAIEVAVDDGNKEGYGGFKFFLEDANVNIGVSDDQTFIGNTSIFFSDYLGDRRIIAYFQSISSFQNFNATYVDLSNRLQWQVRLYDDRDFFIGQDASGFLRRGQAAFTQTGASASLIYPLGFYHRIEFGGGYQLREIDFQTFEIDDETGGIIPVITPRSDDYPFLDLAVVGDSTIFEQWGPMSGRRWRISANYAPDLDKTEGETENTLTASLYLDFRQYVPLTRRMSLAFRGVGYMSDGNFPNPYYFGGLDTVRGFDFRSLVGDRAFFANAELRFPLIDVLATPVIAFQGIRGFIFLDVGGAYFDQYQDFDFWDSENNSLADAVSSYGWGFSLRLFGFDWNWSFAKIWDFDQTLTNGFKTSFFIGNRF